MNFINETSSVRYRFRRIGHRRLWFVLLFVSGGNCFPNPEPFLLVNRGDINIHDSVQRVGHDHYKSHGGKVRYWNVGIDTGETEPNDRRAKAVGETAAARGFPNGLSISADSVPAYSQQNVIQRRESGFKPSRNPYQQGLFNSVNILQNAPSNEQQFKVERQPVQLPPSQQVHQPIIVLTTTIGYVNREDMNYQQPQSHLPSITYEPGYNGPHYQPQGQGPRQNGFQKLMTGLKGRFNKAMATMKNAFKSMIYKRKNPRNQGPGRKEFANGNGHHRRNGILELDFWDLASPMRRLYRWFSGANTRIYT